MQAVEGKIFIKSTILDEYGKSVTKYEYDCTLTIADNGEYTIKYAYDTENGDNVKNVIRLSGKKAKIHRFGNFSHSLEIIPGKISRCNIVIDGETSGFDIKGIDVKYNLSKSGGKVRLRYFNVGTVTLEMEIAEKV